MKLESLRAKIRKHNQFLKRSGYSKSAYFPQIRKGATQLQIDTTNQYLIDRQNRIKNMRAELEQLQHQENERLTTMKQDYKNYKEQYAKEHGYTLQPDILAKDEVKLYTSNPDEMTPAIAESHINRIYENRENKFQEWQIPNEELKRRMIKTIENSPYIRNKELADFLKDNVSADDIWAMFEFENLNFHTFYVADKDNNDTLETKTIDALNKFGYDTSEFDDSGDYDEM